MKKICAIFIIITFTVNGLAGGVVFAEGINQATHGLFPEADAVCYEKYDIEVKYPAIRSYPGGGGIFIIKLIPKHGFSGHVSLEIAADPLLNAELDTAILDEDSPIAELTIQPADYIDIKPYEIVLTTTHQKKSMHSFFLEWVSNLPLPFVSRFITFLIEFIDDKWDTESISPIEKECVFEVEMFNWNSGNLADAVIKRDEFIGWLEVEHPEFGIFSGENPFAYVTYPAHLIVEHWTFLYDQWEMRICYHVMIPPYNWSMLCLRPRGAFDTLFAAKREYDGTTYEIPVSEYPICYGY